MKQSVPHTVGKEMAQKVAKAAISSYTKRFSEYGAQANWSTDDRAEIGFSIKGMSLKGQVTVRDNAIDLDMDVPFLFRPFQKQAMGKIENEINTWMDKAKKGDI